ncbi:MAG: hypothetical protein V3S43_06420 [Acidimicrobiia bacterium]
MIIVARTKVDGKETGRNWSQESEDIIEDEDAQFLNWLIGTLERNSGATVVEVAMDRFRNVKLQGGNGSE